MSKKCVSWPMNTECRDAPVHGCFCKKHYKMFRGRNLKITNISPKEVTMSEKCVSWPMNTECRDAPVHGCFCKKHYKMFRGRGQSIPSIDRCCWALHGVRCSETEGVWDEKGRPIDGLCKLHRGRKSRGKIGPIGRMKAGRKPGPHLVQDGPALRRQEEKEKHDKERSSNRILELFASEEGRQLQECIADKDRAEKKLEVSRKRERRCQAILADLSNRVGQAKAELEEAQLLLDVALSEMQKKQRGVA